MSQNNNLFLTALVLLATQLTVTVNCSPLLTAGNDLKLSEDKHHLCGSRLKQAIVLTCKLSSFHDPENLMNDDLSEESDSEYYESSSSEEASALTNRLKRAIESPLTIAFSLVSKCCNSGCSREDIATLCRTENWIPTTTASPTKADSESQESNESTVEEDDSSQTDTELETPLANDLVIFQNNHGQRTNPIRKTVPYRYSYRTT